MQISFAPHLRNLVISCYAMRTHARKSPMYSGKLMIADQIAPGFAMSVVLAIAHTKRISDGGSVALTLCRFHDKAKNRPGQCKVSGRGPSAHLP